MGGKASPSPGPAAASPSPGSAAASPSPGPAAASPSPVPEGDIVADDDAVEDESLGLADNASSSVSMNSSILRYRHENGRRYHAFKDGAYNYPNDAAEAERMDLQHMMCNITLNGALFLSPLDPNLISRVLDIGTGTGLWATDLADDHPHIKVVGVDLSPIQPSFIPPNVEFYVEDVEDHWTYTKPFDFIYARMLTGSIGDWPRFYKQSFQHLVPGGFIELMDIAFPVACDDGTMPEDSALSQWTKHCCTAAANLGRPYNNKSDVIISQLHEAGFTNITLQPFKWPQNYWPKDKKFKELGICMYENIASNLHGLSAAIFTRGLGWTSEELEIFLIQVRKEMRDPSFHIYFPVNVVYAQKPGF